MKLRIFTSILVCMMFIVSSGCASLQNIKEPEVSLLAIEPIPTQGMAARFKLKLLVVNPNNIPLPIEGVHFKLEVADGKLFSGVGNNIPTIEAYGETEVEVNAIMSLFGLVQLVTKLGTLSNQPISYRLQTTIDPVGFMAFDLEQEGVLNQQMLSGLQGQAH